VPLIVISTKLLLLHFNIGNILFYLAKNGALYFLFLFLLCLVKEEFALWAGAIGIYLIFSQKQIKIGLSTIAGAIVFIFYSNRHNNASLKLFRSKLCLWQLISWF